MRLGICADLDDYVIGIDKVEEGGPFDSVVAVTGAGEVVRWRDCAWRT